MPGLIIWRSRAHDLFEQGPTSTQRLAAAVFPVLTLSRSPSWSTSDHSGRKRSPTGIAVLLGRRHREHSEIQEPFAVLQGVLLDVSDDR